MKTDVLMCVGQDDVEYLFLHSITSCVRNIEVANRIVVVTPDRERVLNRLREGGRSGVEIDVLEDREVLSPALMELPSWTRQQVIKLHAKEICETEFVTCVGADTIVLRHLSERSLFEQDRPILYYNRYPTPQPHLEYERRRIRNVASILGVAPERSLPLGDFIMDVMVFDTDVLNALHRYLRTKHGAEPMLNILPVACSTLEEKVAFGEWSLYAVFLLDVLRADPPMRNSNSDHLAQVHSSGDLERFDFSSNIAHFVSKNFPRNYILDRLLGLGLNGRFS
jgi:hypothetical protein